MNMQQSEYVKKKFCEDDVPYGLYQSLEIDADITTDTVSATTVLWIGYKKYINTGDKIYLHSRACNIKEVYINNIPAEFIIRDPLSNLSSLPPGSRPHYVAKEVDTNYRAALELSRIGELQIIVPSFSECNESIELPKAIPRSSPRDVIARYQKLVRTFYDLTEVRSSAASPVGDHEMSPYSSSSYEVPNGRRFLQIKIIYDIPNAIKSKRNQCGIVFRHRLPFSNDFEIGMNRTAGIQTDGTNNSEAGATETAQSVYTASFSTGTLRDLDGVRCWLPCLDSLDQRIVFDIGIKAPKHWRVACVGKKISTFPIPSFTNDDSQPEKKISRFFTPNRIPVVNVGFYMGNVEMYKMNLYRVRSRIWVATGLQDFISKASNNISTAVVGFEDTGSSESDESDNENSSKNLYNKFLGPIGYNQDVDDKMNYNDDLLPIRKLGDDHYLSLKRNRVINRSNSLLEAVRIDKSNTNDNNYTVENTDKADEPALKKARTENGVAVHDLSNNNSSETRNKSHRFTAKRLYAESVHHSTLGLDMALRLLHKFTGHRYDYDEFTFIYVSNLGCDFISYDGFVLINQAFLHTIKQIYIETAAHMLLLKAYLYSWLKSSLPVSSYEAEFILHGTVGYLLNFYAEEIFGEEEGRYRYLKQYDTVIELEKQGRGVPLANFFPEEYAVFGVSYGQYLQCKSAVLFQLTEHRIGGKDQMRMTLKKLIRSPAVYATAMSTPRYLKGSVHLTDSYPTSPEHPDLQQQLLYSNNPDDSSSAGGFSPYTPSIGASSPYSTMGGNMSPYSLTSQSPYPYGGMSPYSQVGENLSPYPYGAGGNVSPYPTLQHGQMSPYVVGVSSFIGASSTSPYLDPYAVDETVSSRHSKPMVESNKVETDKVEEMGESSQKYDVPGSPTASHQPDIKNEDGVSNVQTKAVSLSKINKESFNSLSTSAGEPEQLHDSLVVAQTAGGYYAQMARRHAREKPSIESSAADIEHSTVDPAVQNSLQITENQQINSSADAKIPTSDALTLVKPIKIDTGYRRQRSVTSETAFMQDLSLLSSDCVSAESFVQLVRNISGASAEINEDFLDQYVYNSGVYMLRIHLYVSTATDSVDSKRHKFIFATTDQVGYGPNVGIDKRLCRTKKVPVRIMEAREDMVTEPVVTFSDRTEQYKQQAFVKPGRRKGKRWGVTRRHQEDMANMTTEEQEQRTREEQARERLKTSLQQSREFDFSLKYGILDPRNQDIIDTQNASADVMLVEQLFADMLEHNVFFQCQALRSLSRGAVGGINGPNSTEAISNPAFIPEKSANMQLKAMWECLVASDTKVVDQKCTNGTFNKFVRAEAAFCIARWQNLCAPPNISKEFPQDKWQGLCLLLNYLLGIYMNTETQLPIPQDMSDENSVFIRNALLLAISDIKAQSGHSPYEVVENLLIFARFVNDGNREINEQYSDDEDEGVDSRVLNNRKSKDVNKKVHFASTPEIKVVNNSDATPLSGNLDSKTTVNRRKSGLPSKKSSANHIPHKSEEYDSTHFRAVLFLALSRMQFESMLAVDNEYRPNNYTHPINEIVSLASSAITASFTQARAVARIQYSPGDANLLPYLPGGGIDVAAAITCLAEMDIQAIQLYASGRAPVNKQRMKVLDLIGPTGLGIISDFCYTKYFLPASAKLVCLAEDVSSLRQNSTGNIISLKDKITYHLCSPIVRAAAFEGFVRLCFASHFACLESSRLKLTSAKVSGLSSRNSAQQLQEIEQQSNETSYIAATVEGLKELLTHETNHWVRQQAAFILVDAMMDQPARIAAQALSLSDPWSCMGWSDPTALTIPSPTWYHQSNSRASTLKPINKSGLYTHGAYMKIAMKILWKTIVGTSKFEQSIRSILLIGWRYVFGADRPPPVLQTRESEITVYDPFFEEFNQKVRFNIYNILNVLQPMKMTCEIEQSLLWGPQHRNKEIYATVAKSVAAAAIEQEESNGGAKGNESLTLSLTGASRSSAGDKDVKKEDYNRDKGLRLSLGRSKATIPEKTNESISSSAAGKTPKFRLVL